MSKAKQSERGFCYNPSIYQVWGIIFTILYPFPQKNAVCTVSVYLVGLSNQMGALPTFILSGISNTLHRELEACGFELATSQLPLCRPA